MKFQRAWDMAKGLCKGLYILKEKESPIQNFSSQSCDLISQVCVCLLVHVFIHKCMCVHMLMYACGG